MTDTRGGDGRYTRDPNTAQRDAEACRLRAQNHSYQQIADQLGISKTSAYEAVQRALAETVQESADELRQLMMMELDELGQKVRDVLDATHYVVSHGRLITDDDDQPLLDPGPKLAAIDRLVKIQESKRKLIGADAPARISVEAQQIGDAIGDLLGALLTDEDDDSDDLDELDQPDQR